MPLHFHDIVQQAICMQKIDKSISVSFSIVYATENFAI